MQRRHEPEKASEDCDSTGPVHARSTNPAIHIDAYRAEGHQHIGTVFQDHQPPTIGRIRQTKHRWQRHYKRVITRRLGDGAIEEMIKKANGRRTIPQIFFDEQHIGGYDDVRALEKENKLHELLK